MLANATIFAGLSAMGLVFVFKKLPPKVQEFLLKHAILTEIITFLLTYVTMGGTLTALFAGSIVSTITTLLLHIRSHPKEYEGLVLASQWLSTKCSSFMSSMNSWLINTLKEHTQPKLVVA